MAKYRVWTTRYGYYSVEAENRDEAYEKAHNGNTGFNVEDENTDMIERLESDGWREGYTKSPLKKRAEKRRAQKKFANKTRKLQRKK